MKVVLDRFEDGKTILKAKVPLVFLIEDDPVSKELYIIKHDELKVFVYGETKPSVLEALNIQLCIDWREYVLDDIQKLSEGAKEFRSVLLQTFKEVV